MYYQSESKIGINKYSVICVLHTHTLGKSTYSDDGHDFFILQETMTEPSIYAHDVSKLKDADELKQACIGLKDTNRYALSHPTHTHTLLLSVTVPLTYKKRVAVNLVPCRSATLVRSPLEVSDLLSRLR